MNYKREDRLFLLYEHAEDARKQGEFEICKHYINLIISYCGLWRVDNHPILLLSRETLNKIDNIYNGR